MSAQPPKKLVKGHSLWSDAFRRLIRNRMAMLGGIITIAIGLTATFADVLMPVSPTYQEKWLGGARPPMERHDLIPDRLVLTKGGIVDYPPRRLRKDGTRRFKLQIQQFSSSEVRAIVSKKSGKIRSIRTTSGTAVPERVKEVAVAGPLQALIPAQQAKEPEPKRYTDLTLKVGALLPAQLKPYLGDPSRGRQVVMLVRKVLLDQPSTLTFTLTPTTEQRNVEVRETWRPWRTTDVLQDVRFEQVGELALDGKPLERFDVDGTRVKSIHRDGERFTLVHPFGQDKLGRDVLSRVVFGGRISILVGIVATLVSLIIGVLYGAVAGYVGGRTDGFMMRVVDILYGIPYMFLVIILMVSFGRDVLVLFVALGAVQWLTMARIVRGQVLSMKEKEYIEAARAAGGSHGWIITRHLIPNTLGIIAVYTTLTIPSVILQESFLSFIGLSVEWNGRALESWGSLTADGMASLGQSGEQWWLLVFPGLALGITLFSMNFLGDGLRDAFDPQMKGRT